MIDGWGIFLEEFFKNGDVIVVVEIFVMDEFFRSVIGFIEFDVFFFVVGFFEGLMGNFEVGYFNIGVGCVVW